MKYLKRKIKILPRKLFFVCFSIIFTYLFVACDPVFDDDDNITTDVTNPTININGSQSVDIELGDNYVDAGAAASDNIDGNITSHIITSGTVNSNEVGTYKIHYSVTDQAGNTTTEIRDVRVCSHRLSGVYNVHYVITGATNATLNYTENCTPSSVNYNVLYFDDFCGYPNVLVSATCEGNKISINQSKTFDWDNNGSATNALISGESQNAYSVTAGATPIATITTLHYTIDYGSGQIDDVTATYTKQ